MESRPSWHADQGVYVCVLDSNYAVNSRGDQFYLNFFLCKSQENFFLFSYW